MTCRRLHWFLWCEHQAGPRGHGSSCPLRHLAPTPRRVDRRARAALGSTLRVRTPRTTRWCPATRDRSRPEVRTGFHRPGVGDTGSSADRADACGAGRDLRGGLFHRRPGDQRGPTAAGRARVRRAGPPRHPAAHAGGRVRLRPRGGRDLAHRRHGDPGSPTEGGPSRQAGVHLRQAQAEHHQDDHDQRPSGPDPVVRRRAARPDARSDRCAHRGHRGAVPPVPAGQSRGRRGLPGPGQRDRRTATTRH